MRVVLTRRDFLGRAACAGALSAFARPLAAAQQRERHVRLPQRRADPESQWRRQGETCGEARVRRRGLGPRSGEDGGRRRDEGTLRRAQNQADHREPADGAPAAVRRRDSGVPGGAQGARRGCGVRVCRGLQEDDGGAARDRANGQRDEYRKVVVERMSAVSEVLQKSNLRLGMEFLGPLYMRQGPGRDGQPRTPFIWTLPETVALAKDCGPNMGAVLDVWHWHHSGGTIARHPRRRRRSHRPRPHLRCEAGAARGRARQPALHAGRRQHRSGRLPPGAQEDRLRGRRQPGAARADPAGDVRRGGREAGARDDAGGDEEGGRARREARSSTEPTPLDSQHVHT